MRLYAILLIWQIQLRHILAFPPNPFELSSQAGYGLNGYECGNVFFSDFEVRNVLSIAIRNADKGYHYPQTYRGKIYGESNSQEYLLYPIRKGSLAQPHSKYPNTLFRVVFRRDSDKEVDVVSKISTNEYTRCTRRHSTNIGPSHSEPEISNGYLCAHEFFTDENILKSLAQAKSIVGGNAKYPSPYVGQLYPDHDGLLLWPITKGKKKYVSATTHIGLYFLILNKERQFVDIVVKGYSNFLRCIRSIEPPEEPASDPSDKPSVPSLKPGYVCGNIFFDERILEKNAKAVKNHVGQVTKAQFLYKSHEAPCYEPCFIWPLFRDGSLSKIGKQGTTRLLLNPNFKILGVAMYVKGTLIECDRKTINAEKNHDMSAFHCNDQVYSHEQLSTAAEEACVKMNRGKKNLYPAKYIGPDFTIGGPYFTFPIFVNSVFGRPRRSVGLHRVVINSNCEVVGALTTLDVIATEDPNDGLLKSLVKCHRLDDGPLPPWFFGTNTMAVSEFKDSNQLEENFPM